MSFFDDMYRKLFAGKKASNPEIIHETLKRSDKFLNAYQAWKESESRTDLMTDIESAYELKKVDIESEITVHVFESNYANGFAIPYNTIISKEHFKFAFDFFKDRTLEMSYFLAQGDRRVVEKEEHEETIEKWYLKPPRKALQERVRDQLYGNVQIEYIEVNHEPSHIKLMASFYQDRLYTKALPFEEFIGKLFAD